MCGFAGSLGIGKELTVKYMLGVFNNYGQHSCELIFSDKLVLGYASCPDCAKCSDYSTSWVEEDGVGVVYDGVIENSILLQKDFLVGIKPGALSAVETILHCYKKIGPLCISLLDGHFSLALFDGNELILTRDHGGQKPLYYGHNGDTLYFSSEQAALFVPKVDRIHQFPAGYYYSSVKGLGPCPDFASK